MVKNLPTVERSTKIRFGKNCTDDQAENTIVFNASNVQIDASKPGSIYMTPLATLADTRDRNVTMLTYNTATKEVSDSGVVAEDVINLDLDDAVKNGNVTATTVSFNNTATSVTTLSNVGIANGAPIHTLDVGSNLYVDDTGSNVLVVSGGILLDGNLTVNGGVTSITTENLKIKDAIIELGQNNTSTDTTLDLGFIMTRPQSNVTIGFREETDEIVMGFTESSADSNVITPITSEDINVHIYGRLYTEANVGVLNTNPMHTLDVGSNLYVDDFGSNILVVSGNAYMSDILSVGDKLGVKTTDPDAELHIVGNAYVSSNLTVDTDTLHVDATRNSVGIETKNPHANLHVVGNVYVSSDFTVDTDTLHVDSTTNSVGIETKNPQANLHVVGNVYVSSDLTVDTDTFHVDASGNKVGIKTKSPDAELHVVGNAYVSSNLTVDTDTLHVDSTTNSVGIKTKSPDAELHVVGNAYVSSNLTVDTDTLHVDASGNKVGIKTKSPDAELHVVGNAYVSSNLTVDTDTLHVDSTTNSVGIKTKSPQANLHVVGNVYVSSDLTVDTDTFHVDVGDKSVGLGTVNPSANLHVVGNAYVSSNLTVDTDTFHVDSVNKRVGIETKNPTSNLHVVGNAYVTSNITTDGTLNLRHPTTALITDLTSNVEVKIDQLANVELTGTVADQLLVYDGQDWTNQYPLHTYIQIWNDAGVDLSRGDVVYVRGVQNQNVVRVGLAKANSPTTMPAIGIVNDATIAQGAEGIAVAYGRAQGVNTSAFIEGETVYVSNVVAGELSNVKPFVTDGIPELIQNVGVVVKKGETNGTIFVTGIGRANDVPNAQIVLDESDINYVYVNNENNDFKKIEPSNLLTQLQTFEQVSAAGNVVSNVMEFNNTTTGLVTVANVEVGSNISVAGLIDSTNKHVPMVGLDGYLEKSPIYFTPGGTYVVSAAEAEFLGNLTLSGNTTILNSESVTISDRIFGVAANNSTTELDSGFMIEHQEDIGGGLEYANVALIYHAIDHRFSLSYTQNTFTDDHILHLDDETHRMLIDLYGNVQVRHNLDVTETLDVTGATSLASDLTVGGASNLFVDVSTSRVGINEASPQKSLDVNGDARVQSTTDTVVNTAGALVVSGGLGVASNIHSTNVYAGSHVGIGTVTTTRPVHVVANSVGGVYVNGAGNDARLGLEATGITADPVVSFNIDGGESFSMGIDNSINDTFNIANHVSDVGTNARMTMTPAGITTFTNTTNSTSKTTGALIVEGGLGVAGNVYASNLNVSSNIGIGVASPQYSLDVAGDINFTGGLYEDGSPFVSTPWTIETSPDALSYTGGNVGIGDGNPDATLHVTGNTYITSNLEVGTANLFVNTVTSNVGIGSTTPGFSLDVVGDINFTGSLYEDGSPFVSTPWTIETSPDALSYTTGNVGIGAANPNATLQVTGNAYVSSNLNVGANVFITGGLVTNTGGVTKKTYSYSGDITTATAPAIGIVFSDHAFSAKITAQLIESEIEISTLMIDVTGGRRGGASTSTLNIAKGPLSIFGDATSNPWSTTVGATATTVTITPSTALSGIGYYNIFVEYVSGDTGGNVDKITEGGVDQITFGY
jgi:hypothetical protein